MDKKSFAGGLIVGSLVTITQPSFLGRVIFYGLWIWILWVLVVVPIMEPIEEDKQPEPEVAVVINQPEAVEPEPIAEEPEIIIPTITEEELEALEATQVQEPEIEHDTEARNPTNYGFPERRTLQ